MNRAEALKVLHEISDAMQESVLMSSVSLDSAPRIQQKPSGFYEIRLRCELDAHCREILHLILDRHGLRMKEEKGMVTIYRHDH